MFLITDAFCQNCKMLKRQLEEKDLTVEIKDARANMPLCRELGIKSIPALILDDNSVEFDIEKIVQIISEQTKE